MIKIILSFIYIIIIQTSKDLNLSYIGKFIEQLSNFSMNLSKPEKTSLIINNKTNYCNKYNNNLEICEECLENYTLINGECVCYDRNCKKCLSSLYGACIECYEGYALSSDNTCRCNIPHCLLCEDNVCNVCEKGYFLSDSKTSCDFNLFYKINGFCNDYNCDICTTNNIGSCIKCKDGFNLVNGSCFINPSLKNYYSGNILCSKEYISTGKVCNKACLGANCEGNNPFYMNCENKCIYCVQGILYEHLNCNMQEYCFDEKCTRCRTDEKGMCDRCEIGYRLIFGACEEKCKDDNCLNCDYTTDGSCNWCKKGYVLIKGKCYIKIEGYTYNELYEIYENGIKEYSKRFDIFYLGKGNFEIINENKPILLDYSNITKNLYFNKFNEICQIKNCKSCLLNNSNYCINCLDNYKPVNGKCIKCNILKCSLCLTENICSLCEENYVLINNQCIKNYGEIPFCLKYVNNRCIQCEDNYILNDEKCNLNSIYTQNTSYEKLSCTDDDVRSKVCFYKYFYKNNNCSSCYDPKCFFCYNGVGCIICDNEYNLIDGRCLKQTIFNETIENCISYDYDGRCIGCDAFCILRKDKCNCKLIGSIIIYLLIGIMAIIIAIIILIIFKQRISVRKIEKLNENNIKLIERFKITEQELTLLQEKDKRLKKCKYCNTEIALFKLSCGCLFCKDDFKDITEGLSSTEIINNSINNCGDKNINVIITKNKEKTKWKEKFNTNNNNSSLSKIIKGTCPCCQQDFSNYIQIAQQCDICFDITSKIFHFKCGCALRVCKICFNKIIISKKCPGCRKNIIEI